MSDYSREYQKQITGEVGKSYLKNGVKFDGIKQDGTLVDAKAKLNQFIDKKTGKFADWFKGKPEIIDQAKRQIAAANGSKIQWYFSQEDALNVTKDLLESKEIYGIEFIFEPKI